MAERFYKLNADEQHKVVIMSEKLWVGGKFGKFVYTII